MRHDPASAAVVVMLRALKMYGMAQAVSDLTEQGAPAFDAAVPILSQLLKADGVPGSGARSGGGRADVVSKIRSLSRAQFARQGCRHQSRRDGHHDYFRE